MAYKVFANGFPLAASELNTYLMQQSIAVFTDSTARDAAITSPVDGQFAYLTGSDSLVKHNGSAWVDAIPAPSTAQTISDKSSNYTLVSGDANTMIRSTNSAITITVANVLAVGEKVDFYQAGSGQITFAAGSGVTLQSKSGNLKTSAQYVGATVQCMASGVYALIGDLGA